MQRYPAFKSLTIPFYRDILRLDVLPISLGQQHLCCCCAENGCPEGGIFRKKTFFGANRKPLIPKTSTLILYIAHLFICMKIIEKDVSNLRSNLKKQYL